ncbi:MAG TPA: T9SS type A sorting domain-containing protein [Bacteroidia bacterium]|nr:T9SS type A sorting domain-containing protein [Bacteroidia bacterium]
MKKQVVLGAAMLGMLYAFPQAPGTHPKPTAMFNQKAAKTAYFNLKENQSPGAVKKLVGPEYQPAQNTVSNEKTASTNASSIHWDLLCGSMNTYGMLVSQSRPLQYNDNVNAVSFLHRKSDTYQANANSNSGTIVAEISGNWGTNWDSTCIYANADAGRYPQGAIYAGPGNSSLSNAYVVGSGPTVNGTFTGDWYASKKLAAQGSTLYNNIPDPAVGAMQFVPFSSLPGLAKHSWSRHGFSATDDGVVRSLSLLENDPTTLGDCRGVAVIKGTFNAGTFTWTSDTLVPACIIDNTGAKQMFSSGVQMAWNEAGTVGYVVIPGALASATGANRGFQPIVYKTTNSGTSWALVNGIDFNAPAMSVVLDHLAGVHNTTLTIPALFGDYDMTVDADNKLHIGAILMSTFSADDDSIGFVAGFDNGGETYHWAHTPGNRPYLYDFIGDGTASWKVVTVDSLSTEGPSSSPTGNGFQDNPWDPTGTGGAKIEVDPRIQVGRTPTGDYVTFSWVESDTNFTSSARKWNNLPNIKARLMSIGSGTNMYVVSPTEQNVTQYPASVGPPNNAVITRATLHYMSPTTSSAVIACSSTLNAQDRVIQVKTPFTVTNSNPYSQLTNNTTWYTTATLQYTFGAGCLVIDGVQESNLSNIDRTVIFPNPAKNSAVLSLHANEKANVNIGIYNLVGQEIKAMSVQANLGENNISLDLQGLNAGIYMVKISSGNASSTKKLIIE